MVETLGQVEIVTLPKADLSFWRLSNNSTNAVVRTKKVRRILSLNKKIIIIIIKEGGASVLDRYMFSQFNLWKIWSKKKKTPLFWINTTIDLRTAFISLSLSFMTKTSSSLTENRADVTQCAKLRYSLCVCAVSDRQHQ